MNVRLIRHPQPKEGVREVLAAMVPGVALTHDVNGAPLVEGWHVSLSHSRHYAAVAVSRDCAVGIDVEEPRPAQLERIKGKFLSERELPIWGSQLLRAWTAKEATFKAALMPGLTIGDIELIDDTTARVPDGRKFTLKFEETSDYCMCVATSAHH